MPLNDPFRPLPLVSLASPPALPKVEQTAGLNDDALSLFTDLRHSSIVMASHQDGLDQTLHVMKRAGVRMVFVVGVHGELLGLVTADELQGERPVLRALADHVRHEELTLEHVMTPVSAWQVVTMLQLAGARVGNIVATLREHGLRYLLVTEEVKGQVSLRGLFSARRVELALHTVIEGSLHSRSFADLEAALVRPG
jgi:CBS domain containing-hemolysin-like protein